MDAWSETCIGLVQVGPEGSIPPGKMLRASGPAAEPEWEDASTIAELLLALGALPNGAGFSTPRQSTGGEARSSRHDSHAGPTCPGDPLPQLDRDPDAITDDGGPAPGSSGLRHEWASEEESSGAESDRHSEVNQDDRGRRRRRGYAFDPGELFPFKCGFKRDVYEQALTSSIG